MESLLLLHTPNAPYQSALSYKINIKIAINLKSLYQFVYMFQFVLYDYFFPHLQFILIFFFSLQLFCMISQNQNPLHKFKTFIEAIINSQRSADLLKQKLLQLCNNHNSIQLPQQIWRLFAKNNQIQIGFSNIISFCQSQNFFMTKNQAKTLSKYFGFHIKHLLTKSDLYESLKPKNINRSQIMNKDPMMNVKKCLIFILKKVVHDFNIIDQSRRANTLQRRLIQQQFQKNYQTNKGLSLQALKQYMYQTGLYSRLNFNFVKQYIFGQNSFILWNDLFSAKQREVQQIQELQEEQLQSHKILPDFSQKFPIQIQTRAKQNFNQDSILGNSKVQPIYSQEQNLHNQSQLQFAQKDINSALTNQNSIKKQCGDNSYNNLQNALAQIEQIQQLLIRQKKKYSTQKSQLQENFNRSKQENMLNCLNKRPIQKVHPIEPINRKNQQTKQEQSFFPTIYNIRDNITSSIILSNKVSLQNLNVCVQPSWREAGKIKRRSSSKHSNNPNNQDNLSLSSICDQDSSQVLQIIRRQEQIYNKIVDERSRFIKNRQIKNQMAQMKQKKRRLQLSKSNSRNVQFLLQKPLANEQSILLRKENFYKKQTNQSSSRSRISSQKREEIVQKATSEAKLRIQQIQKRALSRVSKYQSQNKKQVKVKAPFQEHDLNQSPINIKNIRQQLVKKPPVANKYFQNDLLSLRPNSINLRLTQNLSGNTWTKYRNII